MVSANVISLSPSRRETAELNQGDVSLMKFNACSRVSRLCRGLAVLTFCAVAAMCASAQTLESFYTFNGTDGSYPVGELTQGSDSAIYGTTRLSGAFGFGTVFRITLDGQLTTLHQFTFGDDGGEPNGGLVQGQDGAFNGAAAGGTFNNTCGSLGCGVIFKITADGTFTTLHLFNGSDGELPNPLIQADDGNFYGTTFLGGSNHLGTIFKMTPDGTVTSLYSFTGNADAAEPYAGLVQASNGFFYGTTSAYGQGGRGAVFAITAEGVLTVLHTFNPGSDGSRPHAGLLQASDGNLYGTTQSGGSNERGTVFVISPHANLRIFHNFVLNRDRAAYPEAPLLQLNDGNFYSTTYLGGKSGFGTVYKVNSAGRLSVIASFGGEGTGEYPLAGLLRASDGNLYTSVSLGGNICGCGTLVRLRLPN